MSLLLRDREPIALVAVLLLAGALRLTGLDWGTEASTGEFRAFHPDEVTLIANARWATENPGRMATAYGHLPAYILAVAQAVLSAILDYTPYGSENDDLRTTHIVARTLSGLAGVLTVWAVYLLGRQLEGPRTGLLAATLLAVTPGHVQQSHYYTVDVSITLFVTLGLLAILRLPRPSPISYVVCGLAVGAATGYRLLAGLLVIPYVFAHLSQPGDTFRTILDRLTSRVGVLFSARSILTAAIVLVIATASTPFLLLDQDQLYESHDQRDFAPSVDVVVGKEPRMWTLYDFSTTPYLFYVTDLLPTAQGVPLFLCTLLGIGWAARRRTWDALLLLAWILPYLLVVGCLFTKPVRYTVPMLPALSLFAAWGALAIGSRMSSWHGRLSAVPPIVLVALTATGAIALSATYTEENVRYQAQRSLKELAPVGSTVYAEGGGFPTLWMVPDGMTAVPDMGSFFVRVSGGVLDIHVLDLVHQALEPVDYWILIRENRARQYQAARSHYRLGASLFDKLYAGDLGFEHQTTFRQVPSFFGLEIDESGTEPSVTGFDRPTIEIFRKGSYGLAQIEAWKREILDDPTRPDGAVVLAANHYRRRSYEDAAELLEDIVARWPDFSLSRMLLAEVYLKLGRFNSSREQVDLARPSWWDAVGLVELGLETVGTDYLYRLLTGRDPGREQQFLRGYGARKLFEQGLAAFHAGDLDSAHASYDRAVELDEKLHLAHRNLGALHLTRRNHTEAASSFARATSLNPRDAQIWLGLAAARVGEGDLNRGWNALRRALAIDPQHPEHLRLKEHIVTILEHNGEGEAARRLRRYRVPE